MIFKDVQATIEIDLTKSQEELWNKLDKDARWGVNKAEKSGLRVEIVERDNTNWDEFYELYKETIMRGGIAPKIKEELQKEIARLFLCLKDEKIIAGAAIKIKNDKIELFLNASRREYLKFQPNNLLYWKIILWGKTQEFRIFDLGGYQFNAKRGDKLYEINRFKERWGGKIVEKELISKNPFYILARKIIRNFYFAKKTKDWVMLKKYKMGEYLKNKKISAILKKAFEKIIYYKREVILYSSTLESVPSITPKINVKAKKASLSDLNNIKESIPLTRRYKERIENGEECFILLSEEKPVHYSWLNYKKIDIKEANTSIFLDNREGKKEACIYDCYTYKGYRGKKLYPAMLCFLQKYLKKNSFSKCYIYVESGNESSIKGIEKAGFVKEKIIKYKNIFGFKKYEYF